MDIDVTSGFMTQVMGADGRPHKLCPVCSFEKLHKLKDCIRNTTAICSPRQNSV